MSGLPRPSTGFARPASGPASEARIVDDPNILQQEPINTDNKSRSEPTDRFVPAELLSEDRVAPNRPFTLLGGDTNAAAWPSKGWFVEKGIVDVYGTFQSDGEAPPIRAFLFTIRAGGFLFGGRSEEFGGRLGLMGHPRPDAEISPIDPDGLIGLQRMKRLQAADHETFCKGVDRWLEALSSAIGGPAGDGASSQPAGMRISSPISGAPPPTVNLGKSNRLCAKSGLVWVVPASAARWLDLPVAADRPVPLSHQAMLQAGEITKVGSRRSTDVLASTDWLEHTRFAGMGLLAAIERGMERQVSTETERFDRKAELALKERSGALGQLAALLNNGRSREPEISGDPTAVAFVRLCNHLGVPPPENLRPTSADGEGGRQAVLERLSEKSDLRVRPVLLRDRWWLQDAGPLIGALGDGGETVALIPKHDRTGYLMVPAKGGEPILVTSAVAGQLEPQAFSAHRRLPAKELGFNELGLFAWQVARRDLIALLLWGGLGGLSVLAVPLAVGAVIDGAIPNSDERLLIALGLALLFAAVANLVFSATKETAVLRVGGHISAALQPAVMDRLLRLGPNFHRDHTAGDLALRVSMVSVILKTLSDGVISTFFSSLFSVYGIALIFYFSPALGLLVLALIGCLLSVAAYAAWRKRQEILEGAATGGLLQAYMLEMIAGIQRVRLSASEDAMFAQMVKRFAGMRDRLVRAEKIQNVFDAFQSAFTLLTLAVLFVLVAFASSEDLTMGALLTLVTAFTITMGAFQALATIMVQLFSLTVLAGRAKPILEAEPEMNRDKVDPGPLRGNLEVNSVVFSYGPSIPPALDGVSIEAEEGRFIALIGPSGCGKSTLLKLILGFEQPAQGSVFFDGQDLARLDLRAVRRQIGTVLQSDRLIAGSLYDNIRGTADASLSDCWEAARLAGIEADIREMPMQMHTMISEAGSSLSGGQTQRVLIARALAGKPRLLLFDEATSALDETTQAKIAKDLRNLPITRIAIAHRLSTIKDADKIYVLDQGRLVETGTHQALIAGNGLYAKFHARQQA